MLIAVNVVVAFCLLASGAAWGYVRYKLDSIRTVAAPHLTKAKAGVDSAGGLPVENVLLIGNQSRAGLTTPGDIARFGNPKLLSGSLSDVLMILHLDPAKRTASILSIPRDLFVPMPAGSPVGSFQKVDAALNDGAKGVDNLIAAVTQDFGIPINHYVELNFSGFQQTVSALGGIQMDFPEPVFDAYSGLYVATPGCIHLSGSQALALVRARHLQYEPPGMHAPRADWPYDPLSDLARIVRDHTFLRVLVSTAKAKGLTNPITLNNFLSAVINQITIDPGFKSQLIPIVTRFRHLNPSNVAELTLPVTTVNNYHFYGVDMGDVDFPVQPADQQVIDRWESGALAAPSTPTAVDVRNLAGTYGLGASTAAALRGDGLPASDTGHLAYAGSPTQTYVDYPPGGLANALTVMGDLSGSVMLHIDPALPAGTVEVDAGSLLAVRQPSGSSPASSTTAPSTTSPSTASSATNAASGGSASSRSVPTPSGESPSAATDHLQPWDPRPCPAG